MTTSATPTVDEIVDALRILGCEGPASAADVLDQTDRLFTRDERDVILRRMSEVQAEILAGDPGEP